MRIKSYNFNYEFWNNQTKSKYEFYAKLFEYCITTYEREYFDVDGEYGSRFKKHCSTNRNSHLRQMRRYIKYKLRRGLNNEIKTSRI